MDENQDWEKVSFKEFLKTYHVNIILDNTPEILYSKKDKEHESFYSLILFFIVLGGVLIYFALTLIFIDLFFNLSLFIIIISFLLGLSLLFLVNYLKSNIYIKPIECWFEIHQGKEESKYKSFCFTYYPIFSGKCHPNKALNILLKLYHEEVLETTIDITQIEIYVLINKNNPEDRKNLGYFFQYGKGILFKEEKIDRNTWEYFPYETKLNGNFLATANYEHQYEWRSDLALDFHKLDIYSPWIIKRWSSKDLKPLNKQNKTKLKWDLRDIDSYPKLRPWESDLSKQTYSAPTSYKDHKIIQKAIKKVMGENTSPEKVRDIREYLTEFKAYFKSLNSQT